VEIGSEKSEEGPRRDGRKREEEERKRKWTGDNGKTERE